MMEHMGYRIKAGLNGGGARIKAGLNRGARIKSRRNKGLGLK